MIDWNYIASVIATVAFDIIYFGAIIGYDCHRDSRQS